MLVWPESIGEKLKLKLGSRQNHVGLELVTPFRGLKSRMQVLIGICSLLPHRD